MDTIPEFFFICVYNSPRAKFRKLQANIKKRLEKEIPPVYNNVISPESVHKF